MMPPDVHVRELAAGRARQLVVDSATPPLSWRSETTRTGWRQAGADLELVAGDGTRAEAKIEGRDSVLVPWPFAPLAPGTTASVRARVRGEDGSESRWSEPLEIVVPVADFGATEAMVTVVGAAEDSDAAVHQYRLRFTLAAEPVEARLTITARGVYEAELNARKIGDEHLAPGWTAYDDRLLVSTQVVTPMLREGANSLGVWVGPGWFGEEYGFFGRTSRAYSGPLGVCARLEVRCADGSVLRFGTGPAWEGRTGGHPLLASSIYHGESYDARLHTPLWAMEDDGEWRACVPLAVDRGIYRPAAVQPVRTTEVRRPTLTRTPAGRLVADVGENVVGVVRFTARADRGHLVTFRHSEELDEHGEPSYASLRTARATDTYVFSGSGRERWAPRFTFHGFRYVEIDGWPEDPEAELEVEVWHTDAAPTGDFDCSNPLVTQLFRNMRRSLRGNIVSVPTDCPQRDERLGWTGDLQVFLPAATSLCDVDALVASWLEDLSLEQAKAGGSVPVIVPTVLPGHAASVAGWGDVAVTAPWTLYERYGDAAILGRQYASMTSWIDTVLRSVNPATGLWDIGLQIGDHLAPGRSPWFPGSAPTDNVLLASAYLCRSAGITAAAAGVLGYDDDARRFTDLADRTRAAILDEYVTPQGRAVSDSITAYALLIVFGVAEGEIAARMGQRMAELIAEIDYRIGTGFLGTPLLMDALAETGQLDTAARLLTQTQCPSWLYPVTQGATTIWESWDLRRPDGTLASGDSASSNHYALGAVTDWLQRRLAGLGPAAPGYSVIRIAPCLLPGFTSAGTTIQTPYGAASVEWVLEGSALTVMAQVPPNTSALVQLPGSAEAVAVGSGRHRWTVQVEQPAPRARGPVTLDTPLEQIVDDQEARGIVVAALREHEPARAAALEGAMAWRRGVPLHAALMFVHPSALDAVRNGLAALARG
ncbi:alpha-L-rhamnosidase [Sinomonas atrocyanea]|nr:alpha-L-rhamnosidase [Sinomonas atrocyanea]